MMSNEIQKGENKFSSFRSGMRSDILSGAKSVFRNKELNIDSKGSLIHSEMNREENFKAKTLLSYLGVSLGLAPDYIHSERIILRIDKAFHSEYQRKDSREDFKFSLFVKFLMHELRELDEGYMYILNYLIDDNMRQNIGLRRKLMVLVGLIVNILCERVVFLQFGNSYKCLNKKPEFEGIGLNENKHIHREPKNNNVMEFELAKKLEKFKHLLNDIK